jgi:hypothetical protein
MCVVIGKYFKKYGWVAFKNRDRNYIPEISFKTENKDGIEILRFVDNITQYTEGFNSYGIGILSASLMVLDDEKEIEIRAKKPSRDGHSIQTALQSKTLIETLAKLIKLKLTGNTLVFNKDRLFLLEGYWKKSGYKNKEYIYEVKEIKKDKYVVRTNHGIFLPDAGYQLNVNRAQDISRLSSESRKLIAEIVTEVTDNPFELLDNLTNDFTHNGQMNAIRTSTEKKKMRTTSQIMIVPKLNTMYVRPIQSNLKYNFWDLNKPEQKTWIEILSNRVAYQNLKDTNFEDETIFDFDLNHKSEKHEST